MKPHDVTPEPTPSWTSLSETAAAACADTVRWDANGLICAIAQDHQDGAVLMVAWMNRPALIETLTTGRVCYWSRSRQSLWRKGESSGQRQLVVDLRLDCDADCLLVRVEQTGVACHTGRRSCFYQKPSETGWQTIDPVLIDPAQLYAPRY